MKKTKILLGILALGLGLCLSAFTHKSTHADKRVPPTAWVNLPYGDANAIGNYHGFEYSTEAQLNTAYGCATNYAGPICGADFYISGDPPYALEDFVVTRSTTPPPVNSSNYTFYPLE